jgi:hypothetical protein
MSHDMLQESRDKFQAMIEKEVTVINAYDEPTALLLLNTSRFAAVFIMMTLRPRKYPDLTKALVSYCTQKGGTVIFGFGFPSFTNMDKFHELFMEFGKDWTGGSYTRDSFFYNGVVGNNSKKGKEKISTQLQELQRRNTGQPLPETFNVKALHARGVTREEAVYLTSRLKDSAPKGEALEAPVAFASIGKGWLGYLGDVNTEDETLVIAKAMIAHNDNSSEKTLFVA